MRLLLVFLTCLFAVEPASASTSAASVAAASAASVKVCYFVPPSSWELGKMENPSPYVHIGFIGKGSGPFRPSINLATEEVDVSLKEYVQAVKEIHLSEPDTQWRDLGKFPMRAGEGRLTEITASSRYGKIKQFQALLVQGNTAYILTAAASKEDLPRFQQEILQALQSFQIAPDLFATVSDAQKREELKTLFGGLQALGSDEAKKKEWQALQKTLQADFAQLGQHWLYLALKEGHAKIYPNSP